MVKLATLATGTSLTRRSSGQLPSAAYLGSLATFNLHTVAMSILDEAKKHPAFAISAALISGWLAGLATYEGALRVMKIETVTSGSYVSRTELEKSYVLKDDAQKIADLNRKLDATLTEARSALQQEQSLRLVAQSGQTTRVEFCRNLLAQINTLQSQQDSVEKSIKFKGGIAMEFRPETEESRNRNEGALQDFRRQSVQLQQSLVELRKQYGGCLVQGG